VEFIVTTPRTVELAEGVIILTTGDVRSGTAVVINVTTLEIVDVLLELSIEIKAA
jgi:hypothetical protein